MEKIAINKLKEMKFNPRKISDFDFENLKKSIQEFGNVRPIVVNKDNTVIGGHQTLHACKELGFKEVDIIRVDLTQEKAKLLNIALNRISGEFDYELLDKFVKDIDNLELSGFSQNEINHILAGDNYSDLAEEIKKLELEHLKTVDFVAKFRARMRRIVHKAYRVGFQNLALRVECICKRCNTHHIPHR
jgi:ParB-like chromosome segregation protein Spo0J